MLGPPAPSHPAPPSAAPPPATAAQAVVTFAGLAGVLTAHRGNPDLLVPAQFQVNAKGRITRLTVSTRFVREALRETGYCPPDG